MDEEQAEAVQQPRRAPETSVNIDEDLLNSWIIALKAERKSERTIKSYRYDVGVFLRWCAEAEREPQLTRRNLRDFTNSQLDAGLDAATALHRHIAVKRLSAWLLKEGEIPVNLIEHEPGPKIDVKVKMPYEEADLKALLAACKGTDFAARRDEAITRVLIETGGRATETVKMALSGVNLRALTIVIKGKGGDERVVAISAQTAQAIDRYLRMRRTHRLASTSDALWLGANGRVFGYSGLYRALHLRAAAAGLTEFHPHRLRRTWADRWLDKGGSETGMDQVAGWKSVKSKEPYIRARKNLRALDEARRLNLGDL